MSVPEDVSVLMAGAGLPEHSHAAMYVLLKNVARDGTANQNQENKRIFDLRNFNRLEKFDGNDGFIQLISGAGILD